ncbi:Tripartite-type tricarboxylate transporter, receptor component TctC [Marinococcus luteus]|jgi:tripartite-type tricarboxylate transporter receptor subunit TctC|uniref:Tripartite-type tricarboxylate transporter, receptor component TctC n=1 Tax=Marinococcus luteus TaxID=1122204 RepID=A0A1H2QVK7_9BACI|nr:tripartite tricarboxylate transporter substrate-binding protein [Marinococcus luteus]SDW10684.1 Tripartite-type tricarboxylate transporter, receptor component TctC [Marinococcus luteus]
MKKMMALVSVGSMGFMLAACGTGDSGGQGEQTSGQEGSSTTIDPNRVRTVIGSSSTGGDTYQTADAATRNLEEVLDTNMQVDAVGADRAFSEMSGAQDDGSTIMYFHDMAYLGVEYGSFSEDYELENWTIGPMVATNPGNAFLTSADAPYDTMAESIEWLEDNPDETVSVALEEGGVSEIVFDGYYLWAEEEYGSEITDRIEVYVTGSQEDKNQALWDGNADIIHGSIGANNEYTEDGVEDDIKMKFLGVTTEERVDGFDIPTFAEQGITVDGEEFVFEKEFFFLLPKDIDESYTTALDNAMAELAEDEEFAEALNKNTYTVNHMPSDEAEEHLMEKRENMQSIIEQAPDLNDLAK